MATLSRRPVSPDAIKLASNCQSFKYHYLHKGNGFVRFLSSIFASLPG